jgi:hypothetical protein
MHIVVRIVIVDRKDIVNMWLKDTVSFFLSFTVCEQSLLHMVIKINLPIKEHK